MADKKELTPKQKKGCLIGCLTPILLIFIVIIIAIASDNKVKDEKKEASVAVSNSELSLNERIEKAVLATSLGSENNMGDERIVSIEGSESAPVITLMIDESLTANLTVKSLDSKTVELLEQLNKINEIEVYNIVWQGYFVDQYGNDSIDEILRLQFDQETVDKINFDNATSVNIESIANVYNLHPSLK